MPILHINEVIHGLIGLRPGGNKDSKTGLMPFDLYAYVDSSGECEQNIACYPSWKQAAQGVAVMYISNGVCSGTMINSQSADNGKKKPQYFMTAHHCMPSGTSQSQSLPDSVFRFNWRSPTCRTVAPQAFRGHDHDDLQGADVVMLDAHNDLALLKIWTPIPEEFNIFYNGWSSQEQPPLTAMTIHHPHIDLQKFSMTQQLIVAPYPGCSRCEDHFKVQLWNTGATEGGSSGSPLFTQSGLVVAHLHGGLATCDNPVDDYFGRVFGSYEVGLNSKIAPTDPNATWMEGAPAYPNSSLNSVAPDIYVNPIALTASKTAIYPSRYKLALTSQPKMDVNISISSLPTNIIGLQIEPRNVSFPVADWAQIFQIEVLANASMRDLANLTLVHQIHTQDGDYANISSDSILVQVVANGSGCDTEEYKKGDLNCEVDPATNLIGGWYMLTVHQPMGFWCYSNYEVKLTDTCPAYEEAEWMPLRKHDHGNGGFKDSYFHFLDAGVYWVYGSRLFSISCQTQNEAVTSILGESQAMSCGEYVDGDTSDAQDWLGNEPPDAYFYFNISGTTNVTIDTCTSDFDTFLWLYRKDQFPLLAVASDDDSGSDDECMDEEHQRDAAIDRAWVGAPAKIRTLLPAGEYIIQLEGPRESRDDTSGQYFMRISCNNTPPASLEQWCYETHRDCRTCTNTFDCGWCQSSRSCHVGDMSGPFAENCDDWRPYADSCNPPLRLASPPSSDSQQVAMNNSVAKVYIVVLLAPFVAMATLLVLGVGGRSQAQRPTRFEEMVEQ